MFKIINNYDAAESCFNLQDRNSSPTKTMSLSKMKVSLLVFCVILSLVLRSQDDIPFMPAGQFESKIDLAFKTREATDPNAYTFSDGSQPKKTTDTPIAFLTINFKLLRADGEVKVNIQNGRSEKTNKVKVNSVTKLEIGFIEDVKNSGEGVELVLVFLNETKRPIRKVTFKIEEDGSYFVNGEKRGKF